MKGVIVNVKVVRADAHHRTCGQELGGTYLLSLGIPKLRKERFSIFHTQFSDKDFILAVLDEIVVAS